MLLRILRPLFEGDCPRVDEGEDLQ
jgi:hypothetical protein